LASEVLDQVYHFYLILHWLACLTHFNARNIQISPSQDL
jgi:hypothetical protein